MRTLGKALLILVFLAGAALAAFLIFAPAIVEKGRNPVAAHDPHPVSDQAAALHAELIVGDWHADSLLWKRDLTQRGTRGQVDIPRLIEGNVAVQVFTAVTKSPAGQNYDSNSADTRDNITLLAMGQFWPLRTWNSIFHRAVYQANKLEKFASRSHGQLRIILSEADLDALLTDRAAGKKVVGGLLGLEGGHPLEGEIANLDRLQQAGYRLVGLQHFFDNALGGSLHGRGNLGLTEFGKEVVRAVEERGLILDLAHSSPQVARDVLAMTDMPIVVSHTGLHSHHPVKRNFEDDLMRDIAATGGVIAIGYWSDVTGDDSPAGVAATIVAAVAELGEDHVSLGSDFDGSVGTAFDTSELAALTHELLEQGLTEPQIRKVMGENMIRVLRARLN